MIASEKWHQNITDNNQLKFKKWLEVNENKKNFSEKMINSGNYINDYAHSFFGEDF